MSTLKTTITLASSELFPGTVSFAKVKNYTVDGDSDFQTTEIPANDSLDLFDAPAQTGTSGIVYFYCEAASNNTTNLTIQIKNGSTANATSAMILAPGAVSFLPLFAQDALGLVVTAINDTASACDISYFIGEAD